MDEREECFAVIEGALRDRDSTCEVALLTHFFNLKLERKRETRP